MHLFELELLTEDPDIAVVTETWFRESSLVKVNGYSLFRKDRGNRGGGVAIYVKECLCPNEVCVPNLRDSFVENIWCSIQNGEDKLLVGCIYRPPNSSSLINTSINLLVQEASKLVSDRKYSSLVICGDFNFPSIKWSKNGCLEITPFDQESSTFVENLHDCFLNQMVNDHTFQSSDGTTTNTLDLILTSCQNRISDLKTKPVLGGTSKGHLVLCWKFMTVSNSFKMFDNRKFLYSKGNYDKFKKELNKIDWVSHFENKDVNFCYEFLLNIYEKLSFNLIPKRNITKKNVPWVSSKTKKKAFDLVSPDLLIFKLSCYGFNESSLELKRNYFHYRKQIVKYNDTLSEAC
ncbi:unnamed protein product [Brachionus calyciflorus]|uniref:Endonuclease/exonuclease/phosphatase domain-containing protein n=1 Tax=Brachionus calyciflorus TaxID=104777 RepID=A0A813N2P3_9BILA|nr:unnamed protein product [Brachionus calyciflorus]